MKSSIPFALSACLLPADYIWKPLAWVTCAGLAPAVLAGLWFGYRLGTHLARP